MLEKDVEKYFVRTVQALGGAAHKFKAPMRKGVSDRVAVLPGGVVWFVELKARNGRLSPLQKLFADEMQALGANYACLWSVEDVNAWVKKARCK